MQTEKPATPPAQKKASRKYNQLCIRKDFKAKINTPEAEWLERAKSDPWFNRNFWHWLEQQYGGQSNGK